MLEINEKHDAAPGCTQPFYGTATVGERGQIVIPAEARHDLGIQPGDKILILHHPAHKGLMLFKLEAARAFLDEFTSMVTQAEAREGTQP